MGGEGPFPLYSYSEGEKSSLEQEFPNLSAGYSSVFSGKAEDGTVNGLQSFLTGEIGDMNSPVSWSIFDSEITRRRRKNIFSEVMQGYDELQCRSEDLGEGKSKILSYTPGAWIEMAGGMRLSDYDVPETTSLLLVGPKGAGKSSLVNKISRVFETDKFASKRAQESYNSCFGDGTLFLEEYTIPSGSTSISLYDTRSLCDRSSENIKMLKQWMTKGVRHGNPVIRDSDSSSLEFKMMCKARQSSQYSSKTRRVDFVIFVVNGLSVLRSMNSNEEADTQYMQMIDTSFNSPYLSFKDDKPVVVVTHGDLLSLSDRSRVCVHLGELLGIHPAKQIFDIPESCDPATEMKIVDMLCYSLQHTDRNLPGKDWLLGKFWSWGKVCKVRLAAVCAMMLIYMLIFIPEIVPVFVWAYSHFTQVQSFSESDMEIDWPSIRHLWSGPDP